MTSLLKALHQLVQQHHLAASHHKPVHSIQVVLPTSVVFFSTLKQEGMVARLFQLCDDVQQGNLPALASL